MAIILKPEQLVLTLCRWVKIHESRGDKTCLKFGGKQYSIVDFQFNDWHFTNCTPAFYLEFSQYFLDRIITIDEGTCPQCRAELDKEINTAIFNSGAMPPKE